MSDFYKLLATLDAIQETTAPAETAPVVAPVSTDGGAGASDESVDECGDMGQEVDGGKNVTMSMEDLLALINGIQKGQIPDHDGQALFGDEEMGEDFGNSMPGASEEEVLPVAAVLPTGNDMHSKGREAPKVNGGGNPMQETLVQNLHALYARIKEAK